MVSHAYPSCIGFVCDTMRSRGRTVSSMCISMVSVTYPTVSKMYQLCSSDVSRAVSDFLDTNRIQRGSNLRYQRMYHSRDTLQIHMIHYLYMQIRCSDILQIRYRFIAETPSVPPSTCWHAAGRKLLAQLAAPLGVQHRVLGGDPGAPPPTPARLEITSRATPLSRPMRHKCNPGTSPPHNGLRHPDSSPLDQVQ